MIAFLAGALFGVILCLFCSYEKPEEPGQPHAPGSLGETLTLGPTKDSFVFNYESPKATKNMSWLVSRR
jgi:hypothetical protein